MKIAASVLFVITVLAGYWLQRKMKRQVRSKGYRSDSFSGSFSILFIIKALSVLEGPEEKKEFLKLLFVQIALVLVAGFFLYMMKVL